MQEVSPKALRISGWEHAEVLAMPGDASTRRFERWQRNANQHPRRAVLMQYDGEDRDIQVGLFVKTTALFQSWECLVPSVLSSSADDGWILVEDLGESTLFDRWRLGADVVADYERALSILGGLARQEPTVGPVKERRLDAALFERELQWTRRWYLEGLKGRTWTQQERAHWDRECELIAQELHDQPLRPCHRDYHSRNLIPTASGLGMVDYQDAQMGPYTYDLASLVADAYVTLPDALIDRLTNEIHSLSPASISSSEALRDLDLAIVQRMVKAMGTFAYQALERGKRTYLDDIPRAAARALAACERLGRDGIVRDTLEETVEAGS